MELSGFTMSCDGMLRFSCASFYFFKVLMCSNCLDVLKLKGFRFPLYRSSGSLALSGPRALPLQGCKVLWFHEL